MSQEGSDDAPPIEEACTGEVTANRCAGDGPLRNTNKPNTNVTRKPIAIHCGTDDERFFIGIGAGGSGRSDDPGNAGGTGAFGAAATKAEGDTKGSTPRTEATEAAPAPTGAPSAASSSATDW